MRPEKPPALDPNDARYWDPRDLEQELRRVFSICHGCRMCVGYCPSFPDLFERVDGYVTRRRGEIEAFDDADFKSVNDLCFQCKLCYFKCPYTPDDEHPFQVDFPRLMLRHRAQRARRDGIPVQDRVLGEPQLLGRLGAGLASGMSNLVTRNQLMRKVQEKVTGVSAEFRLPPFASKTLTKWWKHHSSSESAPDSGEVVFFTTCTVEFNLPAAGAAAIQVLEHNGLEVIVPDGQTCCGMPNLDGGDMAAAQAKAERNVALLYPYAARGTPIAIPGPTCSYVIKKEYPELLGTPEARLVADHAVDVMELLRKLMRADRLDRSFARGLGKVAYHAPCHLRAQKMGFPAMQVLKKVPDTVVTVIQECSAVDGTWGMKAQFYELGRKYACKLVDQVRDGGFDRVATDCPLSGLRLSTELGLAPVHPIELLNEAYGLPPVRALDPGGENA